VTSGEWLEKREPTVSWESEGVGRVANVPKVKGCVAPTGLARISYAYPGLPPGAKLFRPSGAELSWGGGPPTR